mgnify:CR=1 FL=1
MELNVSEHNVVFVLLRIAASCGEFGEMTGFIPPETVWAVAAHKIDCIAYPEVCKSLGEVVERLRSGGIDHYCPALVLADCLAYGFPLRFVLHRHPVLDQGY